MFELAPVSYVKRLTQYAKIMICYNCCEIVCGTTVGSVIKILATITSMAAAEEEEAAAPPTTTTMV
jgi:hypothetical protein